MGRTFLGREFPPHQISVLAGAGSVLEILFHVLADPGDGVLVPTPSYAGFWMDLELRDQLTIVPVHCSSADGFRLTPERLDRAVAEAGRPVKALLFTSPNNPLGTVYSADEIDEILDWAESEGDPRGLRRDLRAVGLRRPGVHELCGPEKTAGRTRPHRLGLLQGLRRLGAALRCARQREPGRQRRRRRIRLLGVLLRPHPVPAR